MEKGLEAGRLEGEGRLRIKNPEGGPLDDLTQALRRSLEETGSGRTIWASFN